MSFLESSKHLFLCQCSLKHLYWSHVQCILRICRYSHISNASSFYMYIMWVFRILLREITLEYITAKHFYFNQIKVVAFKEIWFINPVLACSIRSLNSREWSHSSPMVYPRYLQNLTKLSANIIAPSVYVILFKYWPFMEIPNSMLSKSSFNIFSENT